ncbi:MAG TPA: MMPL family transporter [Terrimicrobiaceae bacterium]
MHRVASVLARWIVRKPLAIGLAGVLLASASAWIIASQNAFDSDILNLLPADNPAVEGLKIFNSEFTQTRELAFLLTWKKPPADPDAYREIFLERLRSQPWVHRLLDAPPLETSGGRKTIHEILVPLLLNLPTDQFADALKDLSPEAIRSRIGRLAAQTAAGSPRARFELENDPLGLAARAAKPVWETVAISETFNLTSADGTAMIIPVITNQSELSAEACRATMRQVRHFISEVKDELGPEGPDIGVTGRSAYVDEIEESMQRDIATTSLVSLFCVTALFWVGFRRLLPLIGIALLLALTAITTMACGTLYFEKLNIIAISFCSILFGLGDDFSLLLCQRFYQSRSSGSNREGAIADSISHCTPGILWVALTTGIGFLALCFSGSRGFAQLGVLVALGVFFCAVLMPVFLFLFVGNAPASTAASTGPARAFVHQCLTSPGRILGLAAIIFLVAAALSLAPWRSLRFDISPASLEPRNIPAAKTLTLMMAKFPATFEPIMIVLPRPQPHDLAALDEVLKHLKDQRLIETSSSPSALVLVPTRMKVNAEAARSGDLSASRKAMEDAIAASGLSVSAFSETLSVFDGLQEQDKSTPTWSEFLSPASPWWFLFDRMISPESDAAIAYARTPTHITGDQRKHIGELVEAAVPSALVTGWSQALTSLTAWAYKELVVFGGAVSLVILTILGIVYRDARLWLLHAVSLIAAAAGTIATLKVLEIPINLLNVLAFPLMLGVGVDYGTHIILAAKEREDVVSNLSDVLKPIALSGLTTATGFGSLMLAQNVALSGLGTICAIGVAWCLLASLLIVTPGTVAMRPRR